MFRRTFNGKEGKCDLVFVLGWGNRPDHEPVRWLVDRLVGADYRVHTFRLPTVITDFDGQYLAPVAEFVEGLEEYRLLTHSTGGLVGEFLEDPAPVTTVHLSPWWGFHEDLGGPLIDAVVRLPVPWPVLPTGGDPDDRAAHATDRQLEDSPDRVAPTFLREVRRAQERLPPFDGDAVVFYTPTDGVVSAAAIEARVPPANRVRYEGYHELFSSACRDEHVGRVLAALASGTDAL